MRAIKFRAYYTWPKLMVYGDDDRYQYDQGNALSNFMAYKTVFGPSNPVFIMQYTGLTDKNGKDIYEGDIVRIDIRNISHKKTVDVYEVVWNKDLTLGYGWGAWSLEGGGFLPLDGFGEYEVVGNIYENPDLWG